MNFRDQIILGRSGLRVGKLGISSSYGASSLEIISIVEKDRRG
jgi:hypothetical protein